ncbi:MAG: ABC transporter permease [Clostridia bacterium]
MEQLASFLAASMRMAAPLLIAALGLAISERAGMINIGAEGVMLMGAFSAYAGAKLIGSYWAGMGIAIIVSVLMISIFAITTITFRAEQVVVGAGINILCAGLSSVVYRKLFYGGFEGIASTTITVKTFPELPIPGLSQIPVLGPMLFNHNIVVYFGLVMVVVLWFIINKTSLGLKLIAVGEHPKAADSLGIDVIKLRYLATLFSGIMIGIAGAYLSIAQSNAFAENMTSGRGFIAMAVVILGKWSPIGIFAGSLLFGGANSLQMSIQNLGITIPRNFVLMIPYIATVLAVVAVSKNKVGAPSAQGIPYRKA